MIWRYFVLTAVFIPNANRGGYLRWAAEGLIIGYWQWLLGYISRRGRLWLVLVVPYHCQKVLVVIIVGSILLSDIVIIIGMRRKRGSLAGNSSLVSWPWLNDILWLLIFWCTILRDDGRRRWWIGRMVETRSYGMRIERVQHSVARQKFKWTEIDTRINANDLSFTL